MNKCCCMDPKTAAPALIRWGLGMLFLVGGIAKVTMLNGFVHGYLAPAFEKTFLPGWLVIAYGYALPFVELALGALLLLGLYRVAALFVTGLTLLSLAFGQMLVQQHATVANIFLYLFLTAVALFLNEYDRWALDVCCPVCRPAESGCAGSVAREEETEPT